ncbi:MAG: glycosyltransferase family 2 protein [bacterium]
MYDLNYYKNIDFYELNDSSNFENDIKTHLVQGDLSQPIPPYSILIPTSNRKEKIERSLKTVLKQKNFKDYEIIILDRDSNPNNETQKFLRKFKHHKNLFVYQAEKDLNGWIRLLNLARTQWFTLSADDDYLLPDFFSTVDSILKKHPEIEGIAAKYEFFGDNININPIEKHNKYCPKNIKTLLRKYNLIPQKKRTYTLGKYSMENYYLRNASFTPHCVVYKTSNFKKIGGWNVKIDGCMDMLANINYMLNYNLYYTGEILGMKEIGKGNYSFEKYYRQQFIYLGYLFYSNSKSLSHLKYLSFDDWFIQSTVFFMAIVECDLDFEDIAELQNLNKEFYNKENLKIFREKWNEYAKQLESICPSIDFYEYNLRRKLKWI